MSSLILLLEFLKIKRPILKESLSLLRSRVVYTILAIIFIVFTLDRLFPLPLQKPYSKVIYAKDGTMLTAYLSNDDKWRMEAHLDEISPYLIKSIIEKEDKWFCWHPGINPIAVVRALFQNITSGERVSGASTITMQVARMLEPGDRTYFKKFEETLRAIQLELHYSKKEILEMYLSMLPYGGNVEGAKAASYIYFNRPPAKLSLAQSILMAVIPNDPNSLRVDRKDSLANKMRNKWIKTFMSDNVFNKLDLKDALLEPVSGKRYAIKKIAPHFTRYISGNFSDNDIKTSLDLSIQKTAEKLLKSYVQRVRGKKVSNGAVIIIDNKTNSVAGYCGSADFYDNSTSGQVNGITAVRSPGSALKPILYTLGFDMGMLTPQMKLLDLPTDFNGYEPENFDMKFHGEVSVKYALANSLNVPAVRLLQQEGLDKFISILEKGGFSDIAEHKSSLGLSVILGGCGVRLEQLTSFYTVFANGGKLYPLNYLASGKKDVKLSRQIFSAGAVYLTDQILTLNERPDFPVEFLSFTNLPKIAWKTGTSYGKRDAWAIGYNPDYTVGVWVGNFDGKGAPELSGAEMAVPLLFEIYNSIDYNPKKLWFDKPKSVLEREVCSETGLLPTANCKSIINDYYIYRVSPNRKCELYKPYYVSNDEKISYCTECLPRSGYKKNFYPNYDPELTLWYLKNKISLKRPPPHNPYCTAMISGNGPKIISPSADYEYYIEKNSHEQLMLAAASDPAIAIQYWYINDKFFAETKPGKKLFFTPKSETVKITCLDNHGGKMSIKTKVTFY
jgi:penicillin-binding protein 1C